MNKISLFPNILTKIRKLKYIFNTNTMINNSLSYLLKKGRKIYFKTHVLENLSKKRNLSLLL